MTEIALTQDTDVSVVQEDDTESIVVIFDNDTEVLETTDPGPPGPQGPQGVPGTPGNTVLYGAADPTSDQGVTGDFYINTTTHFMFGPKTVSGWPAGTTLVGPQGPQGIQGVAGNTVLYGAANPTSGQGVDGDFYINTTTHFMFGPKATGAWPAGTSLVGPTGSTGPAGPSGTATCTVSDTPPASPADASLWFESDTGLLFVRFNDGNSTQWVAAAPQPDFSATVQKAGDTMTGNLTISKVQPSLVLNRTSSANGTISGQFGGLPRWVAEFGSATPESGSNTGSNFTIIRCSDAGSVIDAAMTISRQYGDVSLTHSLIAGTYTGAITPFAGSVVADSMSVGPSGFSFNAYWNGTAWVRGSTGYAVGYSLDVAAGNLTWYSAPSGAAGSAATFTASLILQPSGGLVASGNLTALGGAVYAQASGVSNAHMWFLTNTGANAGILYWEASSNHFHLVNGTTSNDFIFQSNGALKCVGYQSRTGISGSFGAQINNMNYAGGVMQLWADATNLGNISVVCDYRTKKDEKPLPSMWKLVKKLKPIRYTQAEFNPPSSITAEPMFPADDIERWGFVAHELQETLIPEAATSHKDAEDSIQSPNLMVVVAALTKALQEAMTRIEALEARK